MRFHRPNLGSGKAISLPAVLCVMLGYGLYAATSMALPKLTPMTAETADLCGYIVWASSLVPAAVLQMRHRRQRWQALMDEQNLTREIIMFRREMAAQQTSAETSNAQPPSETTDNKRWWHDEE